MALFVRQDEQRSEIQNKVASELQQRMKDHKKIEAAKPDPAFTEDQVQTNGIGFVIAAIVVILIILAVYLLRG